MSPAGLIFYGAGGRNKFLSSARILDCRKANFSPF